MDLTEDYKGGLKGRFGEKYTSLSDCSKLRDIPMELLSAAAAMRPRPPGFNCRNHIEWITFRPWFLAHMEELKEKAKTLKPSNPIRESSEKDKAKRLKYQALNEQLKYKKDKGEMIPLSSAEATYKTLATELSTLLNTTLDQFPERCAGMDVYQLREEVRKLQTELGNKIKKLNPEEWNRHEPAN